MRPIAAKHILSPLNNQSKHTSSFIFNELTTMTFFNLILKKNMVKGYATLLADNYSRTQLQFKLSIKYFLYVYDTLMIKYHYNCNAFHLLNLTKEVLVKK